MILIYWQGERQVRTSRNIYFCSCSHRQVSVLTMLAQAFTSFGLSHVMFSSSVREWPAVLSLSKERKTSQEFKQKDVICHNKKTINFFFLTFPKNVRAMVSPKKDKSSSNLHYVSRNHLQLITTR